MVYVSTRTPRTKPKRVPAPSRRKRAVYFVLGFLLGGVIGYGLVTAGPGPAPSLLEPAAAAWVFGLGLVCGLLGAYSPSTFWRQSRRYWWHRGEDD
jgi:hypothetical protein